MRWAVLSVAFVFLLVVPSIAYGQVRAPVLVTDGSSMSVRVLGSCSAPPDALCQRTIPIACFAGCKLAGGDVDNDGHVEAVVAEFGGAIAITELLGGPPRFVPLPTIPFEPGDALAVGDLNRDGFADIVVGDGDAGGGLGGVRVYSLGGTIGISADYTLGAVLAVGDVDDDGFDEVVVGEPGKPIAVSDAVGTPSSGVGVLPTFSVGGALAVGDFVKADGEAQGAKFREIALHLPGASAAQIVDRTGAVVSTMQSDYRVGGALAAGDVDGDGFDELLSSDGSVGTLVRVTHAPGTPTGPSDAGVSFAVGESLAAGALPPDADGDGLTDIWETQGIDLDGDGVPELSLPALGSNPQRATVFVESDYMDCLESGPVVGENTSCQFFGSEGSHNHRPNIASFPTVITAFDTAPVPNPSGPPGVDLFVRQSAIQHLDLCGLDDESPSCFDRIKEAHFGDPGDTEIVRWAKRLAFRYVVWGHDADGGPGTRAGRSEQFGDDIIMTLNGARRDAPFVRSRVEAGTFMHELGHTLGLNHGGPQDMTRVAVEADFSAEDCKPNYLSVMNGIFTAGLVRTGGGAAFDYSRRALRTLDESALSEPDGLDGEPGLDTFVGPPISFFFQPFTVPRVRSRGPIDWDRNTFITPAPVRRDISFILRGGNIAPGGCDGLLPDQVLHGAEDWTALRYDFRNSIDFPAGSHESLPANAQLEPSIDQLRAVLDLSLGPDQCPCSDERDPSTEGDGDGVCDVCDPTAGPDCGTYCAETPTDNCVGTPNPDQANCNLEAERELELDALGDACDPDPCAFTSAEADRLGASFGTDACGTTPLALACPVTVDTKIRWQGIVSAPEAGQGDTKFAHCACDLPHETAEERDMFCKRDALSNSRCSVGDAAAFPDPALNPTQSPSDWREITTTTGPAVFGPAPFEQNATYSGEYSLGGGPVREATWRFDLDLLAFGAPQPSGVVDSATQLEATAAVIDGVGWAHTPRVGSRTLANEPLSGVPNATHADLANHYFPQDLNPRPNYDVAGIPIIDIDKLSRLPERVCARCPRPFAGPWLYNVDPVGPVQIAGGRGFELAGEVSAELFSVFSGLGSATELVIAAEPVAAMQSRGIALRAVGIDRVSGEVSATLVQTPLGLDVAAETPSALCGPGEILLSCEGALRCGLACDGVIGNSTSSPEEDDTCRLATDPGGELTDEDLCFADCLIGTIACAAGGCATPCDGTVECADPADEGPQVCGQAGSSVRALSGTNRELFVFGVRDGEESLTSLGFDDGGNVVHMASAPLLGVDNSGTELAITYRIHDDAVYMLDELRNGHRRFLRLLRVRRDQPTPVAEELLRVPRLGLFTHLFLTATPDGLLTLAASRSGLFPATTYLLLEPLDDGVRVREWYRDRAALAQAPDTRHRGVISVATLRRQRFWSSREVELREIERARFKRVPKWGRKHVARWLR